VRARAQKSIQKSISGIISQLRAQAEQLGRQYLAPTQAVGLDIGADSAKAAHVIDAGDHLEVALFGWTPLRGAETPLPASEAAARVREFIEGWGFPTRRLVANLSGQDCLVRRIKLPFADLKKAARVAPFELEHDLPLTPLEVVLELFPLWESGQHAAPPAAEAAQAGGVAEAGGNGNGNGPQAGAPDLNALALVTSRQRLSERIALLAAANVEPSAIESGPLALYQAFRALRPEEEEAAGLSGVIDFGARTTTLLICRGKELAAVRTIPLGGDAVSLALAAHWKVPFNQAECVKRERCSIVAPAEAERASKRRVEASEVVTAALEPLLREVRRTLLACAETGEGACQGASEVAGERLDRLYTCGGASLLAGLPGHLARALSCGVGPLAATGRLSLAGGGSATDEALLPTALGLALRKLRRLSPVDFRRADLAPHEQTAGLKTRLVWAGAVVFVSAAMGLTSLHIQASSRETRLAAIKDRAEQVYRGAVPGKGSVPDPLLLMQRKLKEAEAEPLPDLSTAPDTLALVRAVAAAGSGENTKVKVSHLTLEAASARVEGQADGKETVVRFRMALLASKLFKDCVIKSVSQIKPGRVAFDLELKRA